jgi:hypothetical protein
MSIQLPFFDRNRNPAPENYAERIKDIIEVGKDVIKAYEKSQFFWDMRINNAYSQILRQCHMTLGAGGNFKGGCLYRQNGIAGEPRGTTCDHAVPITYLRDWVMKGESSFYDLAFAPVVLITQTADKKITQKGLASTMPEGNLGNIMSRYFACGIEIITHKGDPVKEDWGWQDHIKLIRETIELKNTIDFFEKDGIALFKQFPMQEELTQNVKT